MTSSRTLPLPDGRRLTAEVQPGRLHLAVDGVPLLSAICEPVEGGIALVPEGGSEGGRDRPAPLSAEAAWAAACCLFSCDPGGDPARRLLVWRGIEPDPAALRSGLLLADGVGGALCRRDAFWQLPGPWLRSPGTGGFPSIARGDGSGLHRPPKPVGELYRRFDPALGLWISLRSLDIETDLERFNRWQNTPRVLEFWQEGGDFLKHRAYLEGLAEDPHVQTLIGCFDDEPFAYFEAYWAKEDRIAPFCAPGDHDRGIHMLVGEEHHRGPHKVRSWLSALVHWLFLSDARTARVVSEPRADNARMIGHMQSLGFLRERDFDFPHKRAALMLLDRRYFFDRCPGLSEPSSDPGAHEKFLHMKESP
ncbi:RimJ/RimL family protein N-acetyltransferase [Azospirillum lipoferum]|uniref:Acetyltransferase n=1 Tax=Azospirillum lipoferum TaxID=193 RepID=A0A5A9GEJ9_AZOLI|nr:MULTISPECIES: GNAT family N-acetyltransferase [Azospirillum]KAA0592801.1 acetyltransferase [Azospirillum lipoferum]MCP1614239.1 RimJ/RimL family protein N-acetyltransferase [Azospirillum lipoferum]MDW5531977.1 GNAT family N-acetyltransferase [Azospirillum sp. NL1]